MLGVEALNKKGIFISQMKQNGQMFEAGDRTDFYNPHT